MRHSNSCSGGVVIDDHRYEISIYEENKVEPQCDLHKFDLLKSMNIQPDALLNSAPPLREGFVSYIGTKAASNYDQRHMY